MGVTFDSLEQRFVFDFEHDGVEDNPDLTQFIKKAVDGLDGRCFIDNNLSP